jgi:hypothetical protein
MEKIFQEMVDKWPSNIVARIEVGSFSGGVLTHRYMANLDARGEGPKHVLYVGRRAAYRVKDLIEWLESRTVEKRKKVL